MPPLFSSLMLLKLGMSSLSRFNGKLAHYGTPESSESEALIELDNMQAQLDKRNRLKHVAEIDAMDKRCNQLTRLLHAISSLDMTDVLSKIGQNSDAYPVGYAEMLNFISSNLTQSELQSFNLQYIRVLYNDNNTYHSIELCTKGAQVVDSVHPYFFMGYVPLESNGMLIIYHHPHQLFESLAYKGYTSSIFRDPIRAMVIRQNLDNSVQGIEGTNKFNYNADTNYAKAINALITMPRSVGGASRKQQWVNTDRRGVCADGKTRSLYRCAGSRSSKLFVRRVVRRGATASVNYVLFQPKQQARKTKITGNKK